MRFGRSTALGYCSRLKELKTPFLPMRKRLHLILFLCLGKLTFAQGPGLLIQQYDKGVDLEYYRKWNFDVFLQPHRSNTDDLATKARLHLDLGANVHYRFDKNFGLSSGVHYQRISYRYDFPADNSIDRLRFLRFPLVLSVYPVQRLQLSLGGTYHLFLKASGQPPNQTEPSIYPSKTFVNSLGVVAHVQYLVWRKFSASLSYRFQKRNFNPLQRETQDFKGLALGLHYTILSPNRPNP